MAIAHHIPELDGKGLRAFGLSTSLLVGVLFGLFFPWVFGQQIPVWPWVVVAVLAVWAVLAPRTLGPIYRAWMVFGLLLSKVTTPIIMGILFFLVVLPAGLLVRLIRGDVMKRQFDHEAKTYRVRSQKHPVEQFERPF